MDGNLKDEAHEGDDQTEFGKTDREIGKELAEKQTHGTDGRDEQLFERAAFFFTDDGECGEKRGDVQQENGGQSRQQEIRGTGVRVEEYFRAHIDGKGGAVREDASKGFIETDGRG